MNKDPIIYNEMQFEIPDGYLKSRWDEVSKGDTVWVVGVELVETKNILWRKPRAFGPYKVYDTERKQLLNWQGIIVSIGELDGILVPERS